MSPKLANPESQHYNGTTRFLETPEDGTPAFRRRQTQRMLWPLPTTLHVYSGRCPHFYIVFMFRNYAVYSCTYVYLRVLILYGYSPE